MNPPLSTPSPVWSPTRWAVVSVLFAAVLVGGARGLTRWPSLSSPTPPGLPQLQLALGQAKPFSAIDPLVPDPTLFALDDPHGFSGSAARALPRAGYEVAEFIEPPTWLAMDAAAKRAGQAPPLTALPSRRRTDVLPAVAGEPAAPGLLAENPLVTVRGGLADRPLIEPLKLPVWAAAEVLPATVVEIGVNPDGEVLLVRLVVPSGFKPADAAAVALARTVRFTAKGESPRGSSLGAADLAWGELVFPWRTRPPD